MTKRRISKDKPKPTRNFCGHSIMEINGLKCQFNMPKAVKSQVNEQGEVVQGLPPHNQRQSFAVDKYPACPDNWMNGSAKAASYFVPIKSEHGMWLDFNQNAGHRHELAIVLSIQGVNPLTGQKQSNLCLEQYKNNCPVHDVEFGQDRFCNKCKFSWPAQNYLASTGTPYGQLWLDGFRAPDGKVRQYVFTEQESRGVAKAIIGEDRVFAIGIAFYLSKEEKPKNNYLNMYDVGPAGATPMGLESTPDYYNMLDADSVSVSCNTLGSSSGSGRGSRMLRKCSSGGQKTNTVSAKTYEIAAGANIQQDVYPDPKELDFWQDEPAGMIYVAYCDEKTANEILDAGMREETQEGFLAGIPVGQE